MDRPEPTPHWSQRSDWSVSRASSEHRSRKAVKPADWNQPYCGLLNSAGDTQKPSAPWGLRGKSSSKESKPRRRKRDRSSLLRWNSTMPERAAPENAAASAELRTRRPQRPPRTGQTHNPPHAHIRCSSHTPCTDAPPPPSCRARGAAGMSTAVSEKGKGAS